MFGAASPDTPLAPEVTIENARRDTAVAGIEPDEFLRSIHDLPWFQSAGRPSPWDACAVRLREWSEWTGPEDPTVLALALHGQVMRDALTAAASRRGVFVEAAEARAHDAVMQAASSAVDFGEESDPYRPQSQCVWDAAYAAATIAGYLEVGLTVPPDLHELWTWFHAGHWPCGLAAEPAAGPVALRVL